MLMIDIFYFCMIHYIGFYRLKISVITKIWNNDTYYNLGYAEGFSKIENASLSYTYHIHKDSEGITQKSDYHANISGGCFTKENKEVGICGGVFLNDGHDNYYHWIKCNKCGYRISTDWGAAGNTCTRSYYTGAVYYSLGCGKTDNTIESATIIFN